MPGSIGLPCLIVAWSALYTLFGRRSFITASLNTFAPKISLVGVSRKFQAWPVGL